MGEYTHNNDPDNRTLTVCATSRGKVDKFQSINIKAIKCRYLCPGPESEFVKEGFTRVWSNAAQWPGGRLPIAGENVTVNGNWTILMDINPAPIEFLKIDGDVIVPENNSDANITANSIWIRAGSLKAGSSEEPFLGNLTIQINGDKSDFGYVFGPGIVGNKKIFVTGKLHLYSQAPSTVWTKLTSFAHAGDTSITVDSVDGWNDGDEIVIGPTFNSASEHEKVTITSISSTTVSFTPALQYNHYGASDNTISNDYGTLDTRAGVGHLTRSIKIVSGPDSGWGYTILGYGYLDGDILRNGNIVLEGVELKGDNMTLKEQHYRCTT